MPDVVLDGCRTEPLASYLKALAVLRLVSEQVDPEARGWWADGRFVLRSSLDEDGLVRFFSEEYRPTPVVTPWNGGSGFYAKDKKAGIDPIRASTDPRFESYRQAIDCADRQLALMGLTAKPDQAAKVQLLSRMRSHLPEDGLAWFDAAVVLDGDSAAFPPLLGTGGNDGRLEFANNQMQRLVEVLMPQGATRPRCTALVSSALYGASSPRLAKAAVGQFEPSLVGGPNQSAGFEGASHINPWDFILLVEGSMVLAAATTRRLESAQPGTLSYPFGVRAVGVGHAGAERSDEASSRHEIWLPQWGAPAQFIEIRALFGEGRAKVDGRDAVTGIDFARSIAELGVARGISAFTRYGFHVRNGLSYLAVPLGDWPVEINQGVDLLTDLDDWHNRLRRVLRADPPTSLLAAGRRVESAMMAWCRRSTPGQAQGLLAEVAATERVIATSSGLRGKVPPVRLHNTSGRAVGPSWLRACDEDSTEFRLARALAASRIRRYRLPLDPKAPWKWSDTRPTDLVWRGGSLVDNLIRLAARRELEDQPLTASYWARPEDIARFIEGLVDDERIDRLIDALSLLPWRAAEGSEPPPPGGSPPALLYSVCAPVYHRVGTGGERMPKTPGLLRRLAVGDGRVATEVALRRLRGAGWRPIVRPFACSRSSSRRTAAAMAFPVSRSALSYLLPTQQLDQSESANA